MFPAVAVSVGRYDPRLDAGARWQLLSSDGREPTQEEQEDYRREKAHDHGRDGDDRIDRVNGHLEYIELRNHETIRPGFGVKLSKLITRLTFGPAVKDGPIVPISAQVEVKGRAFLVASFDEQEIVRNTDFEYVGDEPGAAE